MRSDTDSDQKGTEHQCVMVIPSGCYGKYIKVLWQAHQGVMVSTSRGRLDAEPRRVAFLLYLHVCVCVCVSLCACVRVIPRRHDGERQREREKETSILVCTCLL